MAELSKQSLAVLKALQELEQAGLIIVDAQNDGYNGEEFITCSSFVTEKGEQALSVLSEGKDKDDE
jgi:hypothetical protein